MLFVDAAAPIVATTIAVLLAAGAPATKADAPSKTSENLWAAVTKPSPGPAQSIGGYSNGCIRGAQELPVVGKGYQVAKPSRQRHFGHPELIAFVQDLAQSLFEDGHGALFVGDLGQPRGGPAPNGHKSHQTGLDADLWFWAPKGADRSPLSTQRAEALAPKRIVSGGAAEPTAHFAARVPIMLRRAAEDPRVDRIFVNPGIKRELCKREPTDRAWLNKIRPWWGHDRHFHVRLRCPTSSPQCAAQNPIPRGDGCDAVAWWFDKKAQADRKKNRRRYRKGMGKAEGLPAACEALVEPR
ncbi:MAG: penicillin-insensitive murein endopeptidase [Myxococcales bacterium FL481]|nr:MAG: penicillin-insensitive murein endopeptidase [Myxococcales bacterium FL481]